jgi:hypothetical protein
MASSNLVTLRGARRVSRGELDTVEAPHSTGRWFPLRHAEVADIVAETLQGAGFSLQETRYALSRGDQRMFATMDLAAPLGDGVALAVGIRNSTDKSFPLGFCAGSRVFVCDNLAFRSELLVACKHTRFGGARFREAISRAMQSLQQFRDVETQRVARYRTAPVSDETAESLLLRLWERNILSNHLLPLALRQWREPAFEDFRPRTLWSLYNAATFALAGRQQSDPQAFAARTIRLSQLLDSRLTNVASAVPEQAV